MKRRDELARLFSDAQLEPDRRFVRDLRKQLITSRKRRKMSVRLRVLLPATTMLAVVMVLVGTTLIRSTTKQPKGVKSAKTILVSKLYGMATADALPPQSATTFWDITQTTSTGPGAPACHYYDEGSFTMRSLLFKDGNVTASWFRSPDGAVYNMGYSEDPETPAFNAGALTPSRDGQLQNALMDAVLTDQSGNPLPGSTTTALKQTGTYDLYATQETKLVQYADPPPDCPTEFIHVRIDAATGMFTELDVYNGAMEGDKLAMKITQSITTGTGDFAAELPKFTAVGFNLAQARDYTSKLPAHVENVAAGYQFLYNKSLLGADSMTEIKAAGGGVAAYSYHFAKAPKMVYRIYTAKAGNQQPKDLAALQMTAQAKGWQVVSDTKRDSTYQGYPKAPTETYVATDGTTDYGMLATGTPDIPYVYVEAPQSESSDIFWLLQQLLPFTPGSQPAE